jgi:hypothetical protein
MSGGTFISSKDDGGSLKAAPILDLLVLANRDISAEHHVLEDEVGY